MLFERMFETQVAELPAVATLRGARGLTGGGQVSRSATATLVALGVNPASELTETTVHQNVLPVRGELAELFPWGGLRRGSTVSVGGSTSLLLALLAGATADGCWAAVVGLPHLGVLAAAELGVAVSRLALVPRPGGEPGAVVAALLDGIDLVAVEVTRSMSASLARRLAARARQRKAVLLAFGSWPGADVELHVVGVRWDGLGSGHGKLRTQTFTVRVGGRGAAARPRHVDLELVGGGTVSFRHSGEELAWTP